MLCSLSLFVISCIEVFIVRVAAGDLSMLGVQASLSRDKGDAEAEIQEKRATAASETRQATQKAAELETQQVNTLN